MIEAETSLEQLLAGSEQWINDVEACGAPDPGDAKAIWDKTVAERDLNLMAGPFDRSDFDSKYGKGL